MDIPTEESERAQKANIALATYSNYIKGWIESFEEHYGAGENGISLFKLRVRESSNYRQIRSYAPIPEELINTYSRGKLTLNAICEFPIDTNEGLALTGNMWLPVQAYYAINGVGWATMIALGMNMPVSKTHGIFRKYFSQLMHAYMPKPLCLTCDGGPGLRDYTFSGIDLNAETIIVLKPFKTFDKTVGPENYVGKSLTTTRTDFIKERLAVQRQKSSRSKLQKDVVIRCCEKEYDTSIGDLFYRLRKRSNYENPDMFLYAGDNELAKERYRSFQHITELLVIGLEELLEKAIGQSEMKNLQARF